jgi:small subunit ribosomal protein S6
MRLYDIVLLLTPDVTEEEAGRLTSEYRKLLTDGGAELARDEPWGRRRLAYSILRKREAYYHHFQVKAAPALVAEVARRLRLSDQVLRHIAVRADEELKPAAKMAERVRRKAAKRPPRPPAVPAGAAAPAAEPGPAAERSEP